jgi:transcriptional regulator with XRE-family HTH domain
MKHFSFKKIRQYREDARIPLSELARKIDVAPQQLWAWENTEDGERSLTAANLYKVADALGKSTDDFFVEQ